MEEEGGGQEGGGGEEGGGTGLLPEPRAGQGQDQYWRSLPLVTHNWFNIHYWLFVYGLCSAQSVRQGGQD